MLENTRRRQFRVRPPIQTPGGQVRGWWCPSKFSNLLSGRGGGGEPPSHSLPLFFFFLFPFTVPALDSTPPGHFPHKTLPRRSPGLPSPAPRSQLSYLPALGRHNPLHGLTLCGRLVFCNKLCLFFLPACLLWSC